jgi:hypothetical protein
VLWEKKTVKVKQALRKVTIFQMQGNHAGKRQNAKFRTFYWKSRSETNSIWPNKSVINNRTSSRSYARRLICIIFKIKENMTAVLRCWNGWMSVPFCVTRRKRSETRHICKF